MDPILVGAGEVHAASPIIPALLFIVATAAAAALILDWAREEKKPEPPWRWGDAPRRPAPSNAIEAHAWGLCAFISELIVGLAYLA